MTETHIFSIEFVGDTPPQPVECYLALDQVTGCVVATQKHVADVWISGGSVVNSPCDLLYVDLQQRLGDVIRIQLI